MAVSPSHLSLCNGPLWTLIPLPAWPVAQEETPGFPVLAAGWGVGLPHVLHVPCPVHKTGAGPAVLPRCVLVGQKLPS